jgi:hypothetical protein
MARLIERGIFGAAAALAAALVATDARACDLPPPESASVAAVLDGETLKLADGRIVKLIGAKARRSRRTAGAAMTRGPSSRRPRRRSKLLRLTRRSSSASAEAAPTGTAIFSRKSSPLREIARCGSRRNS